MTGPFYRVESTGDPGECESCHQACEMWTIVFESGGEPTEVGTAWGDKELAQDICDLMNMAFDAGEESVPTPTKTYIEKDFSRE